MKKFTGLVILDNVRDVEHFNIGEEHFGCITSVARQEFGILLVEETHKSDGYGKELHKLYEAKDRIRLLINRLESMRK